MFRGDIFAEGNYRRRVWLGNDRNQSNTGITPIRSLSKLMNWQPWFQWSPESQSFTAKTSGAPLQILNHFQSISGSKDAIVIYRGSSTPETSAEYKAALADPYDNPISNSTLIFTTPSKAAAMRFASSYLLKATISFKKLRELIAGSKPSLYVGIEFDYPELAFLMTQAPTNIWFESSKVECVKEKINGYKLCSQEK